jgi:four helix bundle protein
MATVERFEDLNVWKKSRLFCRNLNDLTNQGSFAKDFELKNQINRSSGSVMDNIAEGFGRDGRSEFIQYLSISKASASEVKSQLYRAADRDHLTGEQFKKLYLDIDEISRMLRGLIEYLKDCELKGLKYKPTQESGLDDYRV